VSCSKPEFASTMLHQLLTWWNASAIVLAQVCNKHLHKTHKSTRKHAVVGGRILDHLRISE
jgi:hypothetical protein